MVSQRRGQGHELLSKLGAWGKWEVGEREGEKRKGEENMRYKED